MHLKYKVARLKSSMCFACKLSLGSVWFSARSILKSRHAQNRVKICRTTRERATLNGKTVVRSPLFLHSLVNRLTYVNLFTRPQPTYVSTCPYKYGPLHF